MKISCFGAECNGDVGRETHRKTFPFVIKVNKSILEYPMAPEEKKNYVIWLFPGDQFVAQMVEGTAFPSDLWISE